VKEPRKKPGGTNREVALHRNRPQTQQREEPGDISREVADAKRGGIECASLVKTPPIPRTKRGAVRGSDLKRKGAYHQANKMLPSYEQGTRGRDRSGREFGVLCWFSPCRKQIQKKRIGNARPDRQKGEQIKPRKRNLLQ